MLQIQSDDIPNEVHVNDFHWFVTTVIEAIISATKIVILLTPLRLTIANTLLVYDKNKSVLKMEFSERFSSFCSYATIVLL